jgi:hypothetical protein
MVESGGYSESGERLLYERHSLGYLSPAEFALLLSAQVSARGRTDERRTLRAALHPNHARLFERGCQEFAQEPAALRARLGIPEPDAWPAQPAIDELLAKRVEEDEIVRTAASFGDDPQSYRRFATVLERRFEEWKTAGGERPVHAM